MSRICHNRSFNHPQKKITEINPILMEIMEPYRFPMGSWLGIGGLALLHSSSFTLDAKVESVRGMIPTLWFYHLSIRILGEANMLLWKPIMLWRIKIHSKLCNIMLVATKVHVILRNYIVLTWVWWKRNSVACDIMKLHKVDIAILTTWCVQACGLISSTAYFIVKSHDIWEGNVTIWSEIQTKHNRSLGFWDIREGVTLRRLILWRSSVFVCNNYIFLRSWHPQHVGVITVKWTTLVLFEWEWFRICETSICKLPKKLRLQDTRALCWPTSPCMLVCVLACSNDGNPCKCYGTLPPLGVWNMKAWQENGARWVPPSFCFILCFQTLG